MSGPTFSFRVISEVSRSSLVILFAALLGCSGGPEFVNSPSVSPNPNPRVPLAAVVTFSTAGPVHTAIEVSDSGNEWTLEYDQTRDPSAGLPVIGMRPDRDHEIRVTITAGGASTTSGPLTFRTPKMPETIDEAPPIEVRTADSSRMEPGFTFLSLRREKVGGGPEILRFNESFGMLMAVDADGVPVWYYRSDSRLNDFERLRNGNFIFLTADFRAVEIDPLGNEVAQWYAAKRPQGPAEGAIPVDTETFHHEIDEMPNGNLIVLGTRVKEVANYYTSEYDPDAPRKTQKLVGDEIVEFERDTGKVVFKWDSYDHLDPFRMGYLTLNRFWIRRGFPDSYGWTHGNNVLYVEKDDSLLVNLRKQCAIVKIDHSSGDIKWIIGEPTDWGELADKVLKPEGDLDWFYYQHAPYPTPNGIVLFDNGIYRSRPFGERKRPAESRTRAVEYAIDEEAMTVRQLWSSEAVEGEKVVSWAMGDVEHLPETGNILATYGAMLPPDQLDDLEWDAMFNTRNWTRVREYTRTDPPELVWEIVLDAPDSPIGWTAFGGERVPSLTP